MTGAVIGYLLGVLSGWVMCICVLIFVNHHFDSKNNNHRK